MYPHLNSSKTLVMVNYFLQLTIVVGDANDNGPVCPTLPEIQLQNDVEIGHILLQLLVSDADINENARIQFLGVENENGNVNALFNIDQSGQVFTIG